MRKSATRSQSSTKEVVEEGAVSDVFSKPKSAAAKRLVFPDGVVETLPPKAGERRIRLVFNGEGITNTPIIAKLAVEKGVQANILSANTKTIGGKAYGNMLLGITGDKKTIEEAKDYLEKAGSLIAEEVEEDVR